jgi:deoxycytidylate deaminase
MIMIGVTDAELNETRGNRRIARYLAHAQRASALSDFGRIKIGAVIVKGNWIISSGCNKKKTHPIQKRYNDATLDYQKTPCLHAEIDALIRSEREDLSGAECFVARSDRAGRLALSKPCLSCQRALFEAGVSTVYFTE